MEVDYELAAEVLAEELSGTPGYAGWVTWDVYRFKVGVTGECELPANCEGFRVIPVLCEVEEIEDVPAPAREEEAPEEEAPEVDADLF